MQANFTPDKNGNRDLVGRGTESYATLETLRRRRLVARVEDGDDGRAARWRTTRYFLEVFSLRHPAEIAQSERLAGFFGEQS